MTFAQCEVCGLSFDTDPALAVTCPTCGAEPGTKFQRPSGHTVWHDAHTVRINAGVDAVCPRDGQPCWGDDDTESEDEGEQLQEPTLAAFGDG